MIVGTGRLRFGVYELNLSARELRKHGIRIKLRGQPFEILTLLLEKPGEIVTREDLQKRLWSADTFVDFEHSLNSAIKKLRATLGDSPENSRYVETIPRVGYRFIAPVEQVSAAVPPVDVSVVTDRPAVPAGTVEVAGKRRWRIFPGISIERYAVILLIVLIAAPSAYFAWSRLRSRPQPQSQIAGEIHAPLEGHDPIRPNESALSPKSVDAHELYLKGLYFWSKRTVPGFHQAIEYFQQATTVDPSYAPAFAGLANSYTLLTAYTSASANLYMPRARAAALRAVELDDSLAEAHTALALIVQNQDWDWQTAEKEYRRAVELNPNYATAHHWYAEHLMWLGRFDEALRESERARQLDPLSLIIATDNGAILYNARQYDRAIEQFRAVLRKDPYFERAGIVTLSFVEKGMFAEALANTEKWRRVFGEGPWYWSIRTYIYGRAGRQERARRELEKLEQLDRRQQLDPVNMLWAHLGVGDKEEALADLEKAYSEHFSILTTLKVEPAFDPLRSDPRFADLLRRVGLAQ
ncbi:MAG TPA: winged helix-turn-helix domain-containing protein [Candidatus Acidoferrales bacterium]